ncbi:MAG: hypothetical protein CMO61_12595 [Verrucomicrobiales bacterium]|nr:hypothetical protein [Verrucomicrobiales bacterium]|tara:strand:- start:11644 stop:13083 length:1440 start_codon:yes stop_codon:yes gene_type:complete
MTAIDLLPLVADIPLEPVLTASFQFWSPWIQVFILLGLVLLNALLVAADVSLSRVHAPQLEEAAANGKAGASLSLKLLENSRIYSAACQVGITASGIVLGALGEPTISTWLHPLLAPTGISLVAVRIATFVFSISVLTLLSLVIGELLPKALGTQRPVATAMTCSQPLSFFYLLVAIPVWFVEKLSNLILKVVFRLEPVDFAQIDHTADELRYLVEETGRAQEVTLTEQKILANTLELNDLSVKDILTPRSEVIVLNVHRTFRENLDIALESKHTRFPLVDKHLDKTLGLIHIKDLLREMQRESMNLFAAKRDLIRVSEKLPLDEMLQVFLTKRAHIALVVDEFGGSVGLVMLDDVLDQVVGEIHDEFDEEEVPGIEFVDERSFLVEGGYPLHELEDHVDQLDLENRDVSTVGGFLTSIAGRIPEPGEIIELDGYRATILEADERSIRQVQFLRVERQTANSESTEAIKGGTPSETDKD